MHVKSGDKLPLSAFFSSSWEPIVPSDTPTITIERRDLSTGTWDKPVDAQAVTVLASGLCYYDYDTDSGDYEYSVTMTTTDNTVDQRIIVLEHMMSGGWVDDIDTINSNTGAVSSLLVSTKTQVTLIQEDLAVLFDEDIGNIYKAETLVISGIISKTGVSDITSDTVRMRWINNAGEIKLDKNADVSGGGCGFEFSLATTDTDLASGDYDMLVEWSSDSDKNNVDKVLVHQKFKIKSRI